MRGLEGSLGGDLVMRHEAGARLVTGGVEGGDGLPFVFDREHEEVGAEAFSIIGLFHTSDSG